MPASQAGRRRFESGRPLSQQLEIDHEVRHPSSALGRGGFFLLCGPDGRKRRRGASRDRREQRMTCAKRKTVGEQEITFPSTVA
jgi:hypothetical protein